MAAWRLAQGLYPKLQPHAFDFFPRGCVRHCAVRQLWIVELDPKLARGAFVAHLVMNWPLAPTRIAVLADRSCASEARVGPPVEGGPSSRITDTGEFV
ncbi:MAG: hypothetical protein PS018_05920 [bacterium]|nr:hypothetical protein [bacterium]